MKYKINPDMVLVSVLDEYMLADVDTAAGGIRSMRSVNSTGAYFWRLIEQGLDTQEMTEQAMRDFSITEETAHSALDGYLRSLCEAGYLTAAE